MKTLKMGAGTYRTGAKGIICYIKQLRHIKI